MSFFTTKDGKLKAKLEVELDPPAPASPGPTPPLPSTAPAPGGGRRRRKGASAKAKAKARAALHRATQAAATSSPPASGDASAPLEAHATHQQHHPPLRHPLHLLPSPSPSSGRRRVMSVGRLPVPSFGSLNLDGHCTWKSRKPEVGKPQTHKLPAPPHLPPLPLPPPPPPPPPPPSLRLRCTELRDWGGNRGLFNLAESFKQRIFACHYHGDEGRLSLSRSCTGSSSSSASSSSGSNSDHSHGSSPYCSDEDLFEVFGQEVDSDGQ